MQHFEIVAPNRAFEVLASSSRSQAATMVLAPGEKKAGPTSEEVGHEYDLWLFVLSGRGRVKAGLKEVLLRDSVLVFIESGETHEIANIGNEPLRTVAFSTPPAH